MRKPPHYPNTPLSQACTAEQLIVEAVKVKGLIVKGQRFWLMSVASCCSENSTRSFCVLSKAVISETSACILSTPESLNAGAKEGAF